METLIIDWEYVEPNFKYQFCIEDEVSRTIKKSEENEGGVIEIIKTVMNIVKVSPYVKKVKLCIQGFGSGIAELLEHRLEKERVTDVDVIGYKRMKF